MDEQMREQALTMVLGLIAVSALAIGLLSMLIGRIAAWWDVKTSQAPAPPAPVPSAPGRQADAPREKAGISAPVPVSVSVSGTDTAGFDLAAVPSDLTYEEIVAILAGQMTPAGKPAYSGKKIYNLVGGNYNEFTALMRQLRAKDEAPAEPPLATTPIAHRPTRAAFRESDPELDFSPPPR